MRHRLTLRSLGLTAILMAGLATAAAPTVAESARTPDLWATVNACDPPGHPGAVGIRVSIPRAKNSPQQWALIRLQYLDSATKKWKLVLSGGDSGWAKLGGGRRVVLGGTTFTFPLPPAGSRIVVRGVVSVEWRRHGRPVARARLLTEARHQNPKDPLLRVSQRSCVIRR